MQNGYIKLYRKSLENPLFRKPLLWHYFLYCLFKANHCDKKIIWNKKELTIERGSFVTGREQAAKESGLSAQNIRSAQVALVNLGMIEKSTSKSTSKFSYISICNYDTYQETQPATNQQTNQQLTSKQPATNQQLTTTKNYKNYKNYKKEDNIRPENISDQVWEDFALHRKNKKAPITQTVIDSVMEEAKKAGLTVEAALKECCIRGWQGFKADWYLKDKKTEQQSPQRSLPEGIHYINGIKYKGPYKVIE